GVYASASSSSNITVSWSEVSGASGYRIYRALDIDDLFSYQGNTSDTYYSDTGLSQGTTYYYKIAAYNNYGESQPSTATPAKTYESIPSPPSSIYASANSSSSITVYWSEVYGVTSYKVYRSQSSYGNYYSIATVDDPSTSYIDTGLSASTTYYYKVSTSNRAGESQQSTSVGYATTWPSSGSSGSLLPAPTGIYAYKLSSDEIYVWWDSVSSAEEYVVYWSTSETGTYYYDGTTDDTSFISTGWDGIRNAYFKIATVNRAGYEGALSVPVSVYLGGSYSVGTVPVEKMGKMEKIRRTE
ncbi:MAG: fibronectin type III domain-containing protein, partial [Treponema sp.]|nr:fibronectin type III domain-containing protein [Treponema sp.]